MKTLIVVLVATLAVFALAAGQQPQVYLLTIDGEIGRGTVSFLRKGLSEARGSGARAVVIELATPGGYLDAAVAARNVILDAEFVTLAYVHREAFSAGALLALACNRIYFDPAGVLGAATPVELGTGQPASEKVVSATRSLFRSTAEARGRPPEVAEAMVDPDVAIDGLSEAGKLLTLTSQQAVVWGMSDGEAASVADLLEAEGLSGAVVMPFAPRWIDSVVDVLTETWLAAVLITLGILGLIVEMLVPGFGIPGILGTACLGLFFWAHIFVGLAGWESIVFFLGGLVTILLEVFVFTAVDFGVAGLVGLVLVGLGFYTAMVGPFTDPSQVISAVGAVSGGLVVAVVGTIILLTRLPKSRLRFGGVILSSAITGRAFDKGRAKAAESPWVGQQGVAATDLHPVGAGEFAGERVDVTCEEGYLPEGTPIVVVKDEGYRKVVRQEKEEN